MDNLCPGGHGRKVCSECQHVTDVGKRAYDIARAYCTYVDYDTLVRSWIAFRLSDGGSDGTLYPSKRDAIRHQTYEQACAYFSYRGSPNGFGTAKDAAVWLEYHRHIYANGGRLVDPDDAHGGPDIIMPTAKEQLADQLRRMLPGVNR
jgi:hypothetical protein